MGYETACYVLRFTSFDSTSVLFGSPPVLGVVNNSDEELDHRTESGDFGEIQNEGDSLAQQCIVDADYKKLDKIGNKLI